jgi:hypothetical protein
MKVVVINGSPLGEKGNTALILGPFVEGMKTAGAEVSVFLTKAMLDMHAPVADVVDAARDAGRQLIETGSIATETLNVVSRPLLPRDRYVAIANQHMAGRK